MSTAKHTLLRFAEIKAESVYNTHVDPVGQNMPLIGDPDVTADYLFDGVRTMTAPAAFGNMAPVAPLGRFYTGTLRSYLRGQGTAYTSSAVKLSDVGFHDMLSACGFTPAVVTTGGSEEWIWALASASDTLTSVSMNLRLRGELHQLAGVYANLRIIADGPGTPVFEFPFVGTSYQGPQDATYASVNPTWVNPTLKSPTTPATLTISGTGNTLKVRSWRFDLGRTGFDTPRPMAAWSASHAGFAGWGTFAPTLEVECEATATSTYNPWSILAAATDQATFTLSVGSTQYNKWLLTFNAAHILREPELLADGPRALWRLVFAADTGGAMGSSGSAFVNLRAQ